MFELLVCDKCGFCMPYGPDVPDTPCPEGYPHDWAYPNMRRVVDPSLGIIRND